MNTRIQDNGTLIYDFLDEVLVRCPSCSGKATVTKKKAGIDIEARLTCTNCGANKIEKKNGHWITVENDGVFGYPVWLQTDCCGETLYALNHDHLQFLEGYVFAKIRERRIEVKDGFYYRNRTLESRLPKWIKSAKNRDRILKAIEILKKK